jgi:choline dehydrogenase-like flavoprotein
MTDGSFLSDPERETLEAVCDALVPSIHGAGTDPGGCAIGAARLERFVVDIERRGVIANRLPLYSAHQMGSCRLGADRKTSVADPYGEVHGVKGLFIADASGFPTASGVNPMLSVMALSYRVAQRIGRS